MDLVVVSCELETVLLQLYGIDNLLMLVSFCGMFVCVCMFNIWSQFVVLRSCLSLSS